MINIATEEQYNRALLKIQRDILNTSKKVNDTIDKQLTVYLYHLLQIKKLFINVMVTTAQVDEIGRKVDDFNKRFS